MKEYKQIFNGKYDNKGAVQAIDMLNNKPLTKDYFKTRPDMKQRIEKAINTGTYLASYQRGTRLGYKFIAEEEVKQAMVTKSPIEGVKVMKKSNFKNAKPPSNFYISELKWKFLIRNIERGKNIMMTGPSGCGKTDATFKAAEYLGKKYITLI